MCALYVCCVCVASEPPPPALPCLQLIDRRERYVHVAEEAALPLREAHRVAQLVLPGEGGGSGEQRGTSRLQYIGVG